MDSTRIRKDTTISQADTVPMPIREVLLAFAFFGLGGYLFYAFLYGAMGALVSKTEDISKSISGLMVVIMLVYFFSLFQLTDIDGNIIKDQNLNGPVRLLIGDGYCYHLPIVHNQHKHQYNQCIAVAVVAPGILVQHSLIWTRRVWCAGKFWSSSFPG